MNPREVKPLLETIEEREQALNHQAEQTRARITELTAELEELSQEITHLQITRTTLLSLTDQDDAEPSASTPSLPAHPAYQQIMAAFAGLDRPLRARDLCQTLDLPIEPKNVENLRSKLKRLVSRGILTETEPGLFTQPRP